MAGTRQRTTVAFTAAEKIRIRRIADQLGVSASDVLRLGLHELEVRHGAEGLVMAGHAGDMRIRS